MTLTTSWNKEISRCLLGDETDRIVFIWTSIVLQVQFGPQSSVFCEAGVSFAYQHTEYFEVKALIATGLQAIYGTLLLKYRSMH
jgi:hypothetical protein